MLRQLRTGQREPRLAALITHAQHFVASIDGNTISHDVTGDFELEIARRIIEIQCERTGVRSAVITHLNGFTQMNGSPEVPACVIDPHTMSELVIPVSNVLPDTQADVAGPWINVLARALENIEKNEMRGEKAVG